LQILKQLFIFSSDEKQLSQSLEFHSCVSAETKATNNTAGHLKILYS